MNETSLLVSLPFVAAVFAALAPKAATTTGLIVTIGNAVVVGLLAHRVATRGPTRRRSAAGPHPSGSGSPPTGSPRSCW